MGDEFHSVIKMISGEEVLSLIAIDDNDGDPIIILQNPVMIKFIEGKQGTLIKIKPWMELSDEDFFFVKPEKIITMTETTDKKLIEVYTDYINSKNDDYDDEMPIGKVKPDSKMGYISSVKEARKKLEEIFKLELEDTKES